MSFTRSEMVLKTPGAALPSNHQLILQHQDSGGSAE